MFVRIGSITDLKILAQKKDWIVACNKSGKTCSDCGECPNKKKFEFEPDRFLYIRARAISGDETNGNGDYFPWDELKKSFSSFVGKGFYKDHNSDSVDKSYGLIIDAKLVDEGKYVECLIKIDRQKDPEFVRKIEEGIINSVSMGCSVECAKCSICGNIAYTPADLCEHMNPEDSKYCKGKKKKDGSLYSEINQGLTFSELSAVVIPADSTALIFEVLSSLKTKLIKISSYKKEEILYHLNSIIRCLNG